MPGLVWATTVFVGAQHDNARTLLNLLIPITGDEVSLVHDDALMKPADIDR